MKTCAETKARLSLGLCSRYNLRDNLVPRINQNMISKKARLSRELKNLISCLIGPSAAGLPAVFSWPVNAGALLLLKRKETLQLYVTICHETTLEA